MTVMVHLGGGKVTLTSQEPPGRTLALRAWSTGDEWHFAHCLPNTREHCDQHFRALKFLNIVVPGSIEWHARGMISWISQNTITGCTLECYWTV